MKSENAGKRRGAGMLAGAMILCGCVCSAAAQGADDPLAEQLKQKYSAGQVYTGEVIRLDREESLEIKLGYNPWNTGEHIWDNFIIYQDAELKYPVDAGGYDYDAETGILTIQPPFYGIAEMDSGDVDISDKSGNWIMGDDTNAWGNLGQYYLVVKVDTETGEKLEEPEVTVIRINAEIGQAPQLVFDQTEEGLARFRWKEIPEAEGYLVFSINKDETGLWSDTKVFADIQENEWVSDYYEYDGAVLHMNEQFEYFYTSEDMATWVEESGSFLKDYLIEDSYEEFYSTYYGVLAYNSEGCSQISNLLSARDLSHMLPHEKAGHANDEILFGITSTLSLPAVMGITMCDGSLAWKVIEYDMDSVEVDEELKSLRIKGRAQQTAFVQEFTAYEIDPATVEEDLEKIRERQEKLKNKGGNVAPSLTIQEETQADQQEQPQSQQAEAVPEEGSDGDPAETGTEAGSDVGPTEAGTEAGSDVAPAETGTEAGSNVGPTETGTEAGSDVGPAETETEAGSDEIQTEAVTENAEKVEQKVTANSAMSEYIALHMMETKEEIDLSSFPEAADAQQIIDAFFEAQYQNPLILGVQGGSIDPETRMLYVIYDFDQNGTAKRQQEISGKVNEIIDSIIEEGMSEVEKEMAINAYLCENSVYDHSALENAELYGFSQVDEEFYDSFTAYGVLVDGTGVCASYSAAFKLLADAAGLESIVVTGYLDGSTPHAWNKVKLDGQWYIVDATNNDNEEISNALLNLSDMAAAGTLVENEKFVMDGSLADYVAETDELEYYHTQERYFGADEIADELAAALGQEGKATLRTDYTLDDDEFYSILQNTAKKAQKNIKGYHWMGVIRVEE